MTKEDFIPRAKEILEMQLQAELLLKDLKMKYNKYFVEKATSALSCLEDKND